MLSFFQVKHFEPDTIFRPQNRYARGIVQSGTPDLEPLLKAGLDGSGQIVAISDTGIDHDHCMFYDPNVPLPVMRTNFNHRKIIRYDHLSFDSTPGATGDAPKGHGTHVVGSVVGVLLFSPFLHFPHMPLTVPHFLPAPTLPHFLDIFRLLTCSFAPA